MRRQAAQSARPSIREWAVSVTGRDRSVVLSLVLVAVVLSAWSFDTKFSLTGDDAEFMILAKSLASGQGMSNVEAPTPVPHTKYPFGFPVLLALVEWISPSNYTAMRALVAVLFILAIPIIYLLIKPGHGVFAALAASLFAATSPYLLDYSHQVMSEVPYLFFSCLALWLLMRASSRNDWGWQDRYFVGGVLAMVFSYYVRTIGVSLVFAAIAYFALRRQYRRVAALALVTITLALPWVIRNSNVGGNAYVQQLMLVNPYHPEEGSLGVGSLVKRVVTNIRVYFALEIPKGIAPAIYERLGETGMDWRHWFLSLCIVGAGVYGLGAAIWRRRSLLSLYLASFVAICLLWPDVWSSIRFVLPVIPLLWLSVFSGASHLLKRWKHGWSPYPIAFLSVAVFVCLLSNLAIAREMKAAMSDYPANWRNYIEAGQWIRDHTPKESIICCRKGPTMYLVADRHVAGYAFSEDPKQVIDQMERDRVDYVVVEQLGFGSTPAYLVPAVNRYADRFEKVLTLDSPATYVLKFRR